MAGVLLYRFQPDAMDRKDLERLFVGERRRKLLERLANEIREAVMNRTPRYYLIIGPRGVGKTHFITLLYYRIKDIEGALPVKLSEEEYSIYRVSDLLLRILEVLGEDISKFEDLPDDELISTILEELRNRGKMIVLFIENLNQILSEQMNDKEVKRFRSILQTENMFIIVATAPLIFPEVSEHEEPFFNFFQIEFLPELTVDEIKELIRKLAEIENNEELLSRIDELEEKIRSISVITGGNPRIAILLYDLMTKGNLINIEKAFFKMLDEYTQYYQNIFDLLSGEKRKVFDTLIAIGRPATPKEIAKKARLSEKVVNTQLRRLEMEGYVISHKIGRSTKYEVREKLFRLWRELRREPFGRRKISIFIEFLELWYSTEERKMKLLECLKELRDVERIREASYWFLSLPYRYKRELLPYVIREVCKIGELKLLDEFIQEDKKLRTEIINFALSLLEEEKYDDALKLVNKILNDDIRYIPAWIIKISALIGKGRYSEALDATSRLIELDSGKPCGWCLKGLVLHELGQYDKALENLSKATELDPNDAYVWYHMGVTLLELRRYEEALNVFEKAIKLNKNFDAAWFYKGLTLGELGRHEEALEAFNMSIKLNPSNADVWFNRGLALAKLRRYEDALDSFSKAIELNPNFVEAWLQKGLMLEYLRRYEDALNAYSKVVELDPNNACAWCRRGLILMVLERYEDALESLLKAKDLELDEDCADYIKGVIHLLLSFRELEKENYGDAKKNLAIAMNIFNELLKDAKRKVDIDVALMLFLRGLINIVRNIKAIDTALKVIFEMREEFRELFEPIRIAVEIVKTKDVRKYYDVQAEKRDIIVEIVKKLTDSPELIPEEYK